MNYLIVNSHPYNGSFNAGAVNTIKETANSKGHNVTVIDLLADGFNPIMTSADLKAWAQGQYADPMGKNTSWKLRKPMSSCSRSPSGGDRCPPF